MTLKDLLTGGPQPPWLRWVFVIGLATTLTRLVLGSGFGNSSLLYVAVPYCVGLLLYFFVPPPPAMTKTGRAARHIRNVIIVLLASSAILFEGMICVLFAMPIYIFVAGIVLIALPPPKQKPEDISDVFRLSCVPLLIAFASLEGTHPALSFEREHSVTRTQTVKADVGAIKAKLASPIAFTETRSAFLSIFPLPHTVEAGTLEAGDVHRTYYTYKRWPVGNTHEGSLDVLIAEVEPHYVRTEVQSNSAYFSHYLTIHGTEIALTPRDDGQTDVALSIHYRRDLDPAWYFGPLQKRAIGESADYLIEQLLVPGD